MTSVNGRILAIDPGEKKIGVALSDLSGSLASPLTVIKHESLLVDAGQIASLAQENGAVLIVVGLALGEGGEEIPQTRHARKLIDTIRGQTVIAVTGWDEWGSTNQARETLLAAGVRQSRRGGHQDALAAAMILRSYIDAQADSGDTVHG
jgi:putative holliday junction resolvase